MGSEAQAKDDGTRKVRLMAEAAAASFLRKLSGRSPVCREFARRVMAYVVSDLSRSLGRADIGSALGYSVSCLSRRFRQATDRSPERLIEELRLRVARYLLQHTDLPEKRIATLVGFHSEAYFCRRYKIRWRRTPQAERRRQPRRRPIVRVGAPDRQPRKYNKRPRKCNTFQLTPRPSQIIITT